MDMTLQRRAWDQPLHGHRHPWRQPATFDAFVVGQRYDVDLAGCQFLTHGHQLTLGPHARTVLLFMQALAKLFIRKKSTLNVIHPRTPIHCLLKAPDTKPTI